MKVKHMMWKKLIPLLMAAILVLNLVPITTKAKGIEQPVTYTTIISTGDNLQTISINGNGSQEKVPNYWAVEVTVSGQDDKIVISGHNVGIDTIDKISCKVKVTDTSGRVQFNDTVEFTDVFPFIHQTHKITIKNWSKIEITEVRAWDGKDYDEHDNHTFLRNK